MDRFRGNEIFENLLALYCMKNCKKKKRKLKSPYSYVALKCSVRRFLADGLK